MEYVTERASSYDEAVSRLHRQYGADIRVYSTKHIEKRGFLGIGRRDIFEVSAYIIETPAPRTEVVRKEPEPQKRLFCDGDFSHIRELLIANEFTAAYVSYVIDRLKQECEPEELDDHEFTELKVLSWISDSIKVDRKHQIAMPHGFILLGSTGVGKTTTIAKIAALQGMDAKGKTARKSIRIISIDSYRIGARAQITTFGEIMGIPVEEVRTQKQLKAMLAETEETDIVLIDTIGKSPKDVEIHQEMVDVLTPCINRRDALFVLAVSASMKNSDIHRMIDRFADFPISSLIFTKLDETELVGNLISLMHEVELPVLYLATGQRVPQDLLPMTEGLFLQKLQGFSVDLANFQIGDVNEWRETL